VATDWSDYYLIHQFYTWGSEIADHTMAHDQARPTQQAWYTEIKGARQYLSVLGKVPLTNITGFRTPFLNPQLITYKGLQQAGGFTYDSSLPDRFLFLSGPGKYIYPYTLDHGSPLGCTDSTVDPAICTMQIPGIWEIPLTPLRDFTSKALTPLTLMDLYGSNLATKLSILKANFLDHYNGNRAPFLIPLHCSYSASAENLVLLNEFYDWAHGLPNVFFATYSEVIHWMQHPVPASQVPAQSYMKVNTPATGAETCDGLDNNGNGVVDEGEVISCSYPQKNFMLCSTCCPVVVPLAANWTPSYNLTCPANSTSSTGNWAGCFGKSNGFYADPANTACYYQCVGVSTYHQCCATGLHWDPSISNCNV
jgi:hypothetical protein